VPRRKPRAPSIHFFHSIRHTAAGDNHIVNGISGDKVAFMTARPAWLWLCVVLWLVPPAVAQDAAQQRAHLNLAAAQIERGDQPGAARHLAAYLAAFPDHHIVRKHYAELLLRLHRPHEARAQFERFIAGTQDDPELGPKYLVHCHSRLMEIAEEEGDDYGEHLHRGIGLYLLACERAGLPDPEDGELSVESVLCRAAGELTMAHLARRDEARPCWYLYVVWSRLQQRQPALRHLREADACAPFSGLTPAERRSLELARLGHEAERRGCR
jgi:hypothetical protein